MTTMNVYEVSGHKTIYGERIIEAKSVHEAIAKFRKLRPDLKPESVDLLRGNDPDLPTEECYTCIGRCESCRCEIVHSDDYAVTSDDVYLCDKCFELARKADGSTTQTTTVPF